MNHSRTYQDPDDRDILSKEENGLVYVWGSNQHGQLGLGDGYAGKSYPTPRSLTFSFFIQEVSCGEDHTVFLTSRGQIYTMGSNAEGRLGLGNRSIDRCLYPTLVDSSLYGRCVQVACGWSHTLCIMESGEVYSWGSGESGALGIGSTESKWAPARVALEERVFVGARKVSAGSTHSAFISELGTLYVCGAGDAGQLGTGKRDRELRPIQMTLMTEKVRDVACGVFHTLILTDRSKVYATGGNIFGQLGLGNKKSSNVPVRVKELDYLRVSKVACGQHSAALTETGEIYVWGTGSFGEFLTPTKYSKSGQSFKDISVNGFHGIAVDQNSHVWAWGSNNNGELGQGNYEQKQRICLNDAMQNRKIEKFACGVSFVIALGEAPGRSRKGVTAGGHRKQPVGGYVDISANRTPQKVADTQEDDREVMEGRLPPATEVKMKGSRQAMRTSSAGKPREGYERRMLNERVRIGPEITGFVDLLGREREGGNVRDKREERDRKEERGKRDGGDDLEVIEKLIKQKEGLEKALDNERREKKGLERNLGELNRRLQQVQDGPEGLLGLNENFNKQTQRFDEIRTYYEEEANRREKILQELHQEQQAAKELTRKLMESEEIIAKLQVQAEQGEAFHRRAIELENAKLKLGQQFEALEHENRGNVLELTRLTEKNTELEKSLYQKSESLQRLEDARKTDLEDKKLLEDEVISLRKKVQDLEGRLDRNTRGYDRETEARRQLEEDLEALRDREDQSKEQIKMLVSQVELLRERLEKNMDEEEIVKGRLMKDNKVLEEEIQGLRDENLVLNDEKAALEDELLETQQKNKKLLELLNEEIDKQNKTLDRAPDSPVKSENVASRKLEGRKGEILGQSVPDRVERRRPPSYGRVQTGNSHIGGDERTGNFEKTGLTSNTNEKDSPKALHRSVERSRYLNTDGLGDEKERSLKQYIPYGKQVEGSPERNRDESFGSPLPVEKGQLERRNEEDRRRRLGDSPKLRQTSGTLDLGGDTSRNLGPYEIYGQTEQTQQSRIYMPEKYRSTITEEERSYSGQKRRSPSPSGNYSTLDYMTRESGVSEKKNFMDELREVQEKMEALERNKRELQNRMMDFESRLVVEKK